MRGIEDTEFDSIPKDWKELDAALIEKLIEKFHDDAFYKKVLKLHNPFLDKVIATKTRNKYILQQILLSLPENDDLDIGYTIAMSHHSDGQTLALVFDHCKNIRSKSAAMQNSRFPIDKLVSLASDPNKEIRCTVAVSTRIPVEVLEKLSFDKEEDVRISIAGNKNTPVEILERLITDSNKDVRYYVIINDKLPSERLDSFVDDRDARIREKLAQKKDISLETLMKLYADKNEDVRNAAINNAKFPIDELESLADSSDKNIRCAVAANEHTSAEILEKLGHDEEDDVKVAVATNNNASQDILRHLSVDAEDYVRSAVSINKHTPADVLSAMIKADDQMPNIVNRSDVTLDMLLAVLDSESEESEYARVEMALNVHMPVEILERLAKDPENYIRNFARETLSRKLTKTHDNNV